MCKHGRYYLALHSSVWIKQNFIALYVIDLGFLSTSVARTTIVNCPSARAEKKRNKKGEAQRQKNLTATSKSA